MHNPLDMLVFAKVVELRSFSLTARRLGISRSAASKHVTRLEQALGRPAHPGDLRPDGAIHRRVPADHREQRTRQFQRAAVPA